MADQTSSAIDIAATPAEVMAVIADFESYPAWAQGINEARVLNRDAEGRPEQVYFELDATPIKDSYTLAYTWHDDTAVEWSLVEAKILKALDGAYELADRGDGSTEVTYRLSVELSIPMIGMLKRKAEKVIIDAALKGLRSRVETVA